MTGLALLIAGSTKAQVIVTASSFASLGAAAGVLWQVSLDGIVDGLPIVGGVGFIVTASVVGLRMVLVASKYQAVSAAETRESLRQRIEDLEEDLEYERSRSRDIIASSREVVREAAEWQHKYEIERQLRESLERRGVVDRRERTEEP